MLEELSLAAVALERVRQSSEIDKFHSCEISLARIVKPRVPNQRLAKRPFPQDPSSRNRAHDNCHHKIVLKGTSSIIQLRPKHYEKLKLVELIEAECG